MTRSVVLEGSALHAGVLTSVRLSLEDGPVVVQQHGLKVALADLRIERADEGVCVSDATGKLRVDLVEHVLAAVGGLGVREGLCISVSGPEMPLLDGGSRRFATALRSIGVRSWQPAASITRAARYTLGEASYELTRSEQVHIEVTVDFKHPLVRVIGACWRGCSDEFLECIASARTFGFASDAARLQGAGRARAVNLRSVVVLCDDGGSLSEPPPEPDECARHKLLDLIGDLTLCGGIPRGTIKAIRPGHRATHAMLRQAIDEGVITFA